MSNSSVAAFEEYLGWLICIILDIFHAPRRLMVSSSLNQASKKIVFVKFIEQGALVLHRQTFAEAARQYGAENIYLCTFFSNAPLIDTLNLVPAQNRLYINDSTWLQFIKTFWSAILKIRRAHIDSAVDLEFFSRATAVFCFLTGARKRAGYHRFKGLQNYRGNLFTHRLSYSHYVHVSASGWCLLKSLETGAVILPALNITMPDFTHGGGFTPSGSDITQLQQLLGNQIDFAKPVIIVNPSLNDSLPLRKWPQAYYKDFVQQFSKVNPSYQLIFTGRADERLMTDSFIDSIGLRGINLCGKTSLRDILTLYSLSKILVTSDSGPAHFASLTPIKTIVLFGPETPTLYAPVSANAKIIYRSLPCSPCFNVYNNRQSPCKNNLCMKNIPVAEVLQAANQAAAAL